MTVPQDLPQVEQLTGETIVTEALQLLSGWSLRPDAELRARELTRQVAREVATYLPVTAGAAEWTAARAAMAVGVAAAMLPYDAAEPFERRFRALLGEIGRTRGQGMAPVSAYPPSSFPDGPPVAVSRRVYVWPF